MRVTCKCGHKGRISSTERFSVDFAKLYCQCLDAKCGHTWVANLSFSHTLSPSAQAMDRLLFDSLKNLSRTQQRELFDQLGAA
ncbi:ogr/Delta-like zinc finger family protein [Pseudomonas viridiflava]|uniref:ogr/Delta-like zinc finger family protein n=1 Tax=Pseudomonas viridiflava TaxID=33069 RepID=UPI000F049C9D|nr:ogr/Delta-like zinc finger family protein [Pseudomonas viridiflava]